MTVLYIYLKYTILRKGPQATKMVVTGNAMLSNDYNMPFVYCYINILYII